MDKYEYKVRAEEIKVLISSGKYGEAVKIADTIDWRRVKSTTMLCTISDLYKVNRRFEESKEILLLAYERYPSSRAIVYSLCELSIKMGEFVQAVEYYKEFVRIAPRDTGRYILQYRLYEAQDVSLEERIAVLEEFKKHDYREKWAYELAYLYHRVGLTTECIEEVDEMFLWFGVGKFVMKALELKALHEPLSQEQQARYQAYKSGLDGSIDREAILKKDEDPIGKDVSDTSPNMINRKDLAGMQAGADTQTQPGAYSQPSPGVYVQPQSGAYSQPQTPSDQPQAPLQGQTQTDLYGQTQTGMYTQAQYSAYGEPGVGAYSQSQSYMYGADMPASYAQMQEKQPTKPFYNSPQERDAVEKAALEAGMPTQEQLQAYYNEQAGASYQYQDQTQNQNQGYYTSDINAGDPSVRSTYAGYNDQARTQNTGRINSYQRAPHVTEPTPVNTTRRQESSNFTAPPKPVGYDTVNLQRAIAESMEQIMAEEEQNKAKVTVQEVFYEDATKEFATPDTASWTRTDAPLNQKEEPGVTIRPTRKVASSHYDDILKQDYDGQISMVVPENNTVEDQITGQISIDDIMNRIKQQQRERQEKEVAKIVQDKISTVISQYDEDVKYDLQKEMEKEVKRELMGGNRPKPEKNAGRALLSHAGNVVRPSTAPFVKAGEEGIRRANEEKLMDDDDILDLDNLPDDIPDKDLDAETDTTNEKTDDNKVSPADNSEQDEKSDTDSDKELDKDLDKENDSDSDGDVDAALEEVDDSKDSEDLSNAEVLDTSIKTQGSEEESTDRSKEAEAKEAEAKEVESKEEESKEKSEEAPKEKSEEKSEDESIDESMDKSMDKSKDKSEVKELEESTEDLKDDSKEDSIKDSIEDPIAKESKGSDRQGDFENAKAADNLTDEIIEIIPVVDSDTDSDKDTFKESSEDTDSTSDADSDIDNDFSEDEDKSLDAPKDTAGPRRSRITIVEKDESSALEIPEYTEEVVEMSLGDTFNYEDSDSSDEAEDVKESDEKALDEKASDKEISAKEKSDAENSNAENSNEEASDINISDEEASDKTVSDKEASDKQSSNKEITDNETSDEITSDKETPDDKSSADSDNDNTSSDEDSSESGDGEEDEDVNKDKEVNKDIENKEDKEDTVNSKDKEDTDDQDNDHDNDGSDDTDQRSSDSSRSRQNARKTVDNSHRAGFSEGEAETESEAKELDTRVRVMTPEEKELFGPYIHHRKSRKQIIRAIDSLNMSPATNNAIVTGEEGTGTINLAKGLIKSVQAGDTGFSGKVAKITAQALNRKSVSQVIEKLDSGALIIQRAADMKTDTVDSLYKELTADKHGIIIVMEDNHKDMDRLLKRHPELSKCFNVRVDVEALDNESLVAYAKQYALEREYKIDNFGMLSLHSRIEEMQTIDHDVTISEVRDIVDEAIRSAEKKTISHFFDVVLNKRYDEEDMIILTEKDFERADHKKTN